MNTTYGVLNNSSLIIDTDKLRENVRTILRSLPAGTKLIPVVKDDAYGMGMVGVARTLSAFPEIGCFAVANVSEGVTLRREGIRQDILIMGSTLPFQYVPAVECDLTVTVSRLGMVPELAEVCKGAEQAAERADQAGDRYAPHRRGAGRGARRADRGSSRRRRSGSMSPARSPISRGPATPRSARRRQESCLPARSSSRRRAFRSRCCHISASGVRALPAVRARRPCALAAGSIWTIRKSRSATFRRSSPGAVTSPTSSSATRATRSPTSAIRSG